jgi:hypothetical protein
MGVKISGLPEVDVLGSSDFFPVVQNGVTKKVSASKVGGGGSNAMTAEFFINQNDGEPNDIWSGTEAQFNNLGSYPSTRIHFIK